MEFRPPPIQELAITQSGGFGQTWLRWFHLIFSYLSGQEPIKLLSVSVANLPQPDVNAGSIIYVNDEAGGAVPAFSDGINWRRITDSVVVS